MSQKVLIVLQENATQPPLPEMIPSGIKNLIYNLIDGISETFEDVKMKMQGKGKYDTIHLLTDDLCTRQNLLTKLVEETIKGSTIDLVILGHGYEKGLIIFDKQVLTGKTSKREGNIRTLLKEAQNMGVQKFNLRLVFMCNCDGSTLNDDWLSIGAKASIGSKGDNWMPEPMITFFMHHWLHGSTASEAAYKAYQQTVPFYVAIFPPTPITIKKARTIKYPSPTLSDPLRMAEKVVQVPSVAWKTHEKILTSELLCEGDGKMRF